MNDDFFCVHCSKYNNFRFYTIDNETIWGDNLTTIFAFLKNEWTNGSFEYEWNGFVVSYLKF